MFGAQLKRKVRFAALAAFVACSSVPFAARAAVEETPMSIPGGKMVDTKAAQAAHAEGAVFVDARNPNEFADGSVKGALNVPYKEKFSKQAKLSEEDKFDETKLPSDKSARLVFYCNGSPCWKGYKAAERAVRAGHRNVMWYRDGLPAWKDAGLPLQ